MRDSGATSHQMGIPLKVCKKCLFFPIWQWWSLAKQKGSQNQWDSEDWPKAAMVGVLVIHQERADTHCYLLLQRKGWLDDMIYPERYTGFDDAELP